MNKKTLCRSRLLLPAGLLMLLARARAAPAPANNQVVHLAKLEIYPEQLTTYQAALKEHSETALRAAPGALTW